MMVGTILGLLLGVAARYDLKGILTMGISIGAVMFILPRMVRILMEGLLPISEAIKKFLNIAIRIVMIFTSDWISQ